MSGQRRTGALGSWTGSCLKSQCMNVGCKTDPLRRGGLGALAAPLPGAPPDGWAAGAWGPLEPRRLRSGRGTGRRCSRALASAFATRTWPYLSNGILFFPCSAGSFSWHHGAGPSQVYADYNKSLAEGYFDSAGRVSLEVSASSLSNPVFGKELICLKKGMNTSFKKINNFSINI